MEKFTTLLSLFLHLLHDKQSLEITKLYNIVTLFKDVCMFYFCRSNSGCTA